MLGQPMFRRFLVSRAVSWFGTAMTLVALPVFLYQRTGSATLTGLLAAVEAVPYLVLGLPVGALVDRWDRRRTMVASSVLSAVVLTGVPLADMTGVLTDAQLLLTAATVSCLFVFFDAAGFGALPSIVGKENLAAATGTMMSVSTVINLLGPLVGGVAVTTLGGSAVLALDGLSYLVAAGVLLGVRWTAEPSTTERRRLGRDIAEGVAYLWSHRWIRPLTLLGAASSVSAGAVSGLLVVVAVRRFGLDQQDPVIGMLYGAVALGGLIAGVGLPGVQRRRATGTIAACGLAASWAGLVLWSVTSDWRVGLAVLVVWQAATSTVILNGIVVRQALTPARLQGRVNTTARMIAWGGTPLGAAIGGLLADALSTTAALLLASSAVGLAAVAAFAGPLRHAGTLRDLITDAPDHA